MFVLSVLTLTKILILQEMKSRDFVLWVDGFLYGKTQLNVDDIRYIQNMIEDVKTNEEEPKKEIIIERVPTPLNPITIQEPNQEDDMEFPGKPPKIYM